MSTIAQFHTHTFADGKSVTKTCKMTFGPYDDANMMHERVSIFTHPTTGQTHSHRFVLAKGGRNNKHSYSDDAGGYESDDVARYTSH